MRIVIAEELTQIKHDYDDPRRTIIAGGMASSMSAEDFLMPEENTWVTLTVKGALARSYDDNPPQVTTKEKEPPRFIVESSTAHTLYIFTDQGECATIPVQQISQMNTPSEGLHFSDQCSLDSDQEIVSVLSLPYNLEAGYLFFATEQAQVKRLRLEDLPGASSKPFTVMKVGDDDRLGWVMLTTGADEIILATAQAQTIRFSEDDVRPTGLPAGGMRGIKLLGQKDRVVGAVIAIPNQYVWSITDDGVAKISIIDEYPSQGRAGSGVINMRLSPDSKEVAAMAIGRQDDTVIVLTNKNKPKYMRIGLGMKLKRGRAGGDFVISLREKERVTSVVNYQPKIIMVEAPTEE